MKTKSLKNYSFLIFFFAGIVFIVVGCVSIKFNFFNKNGSSSNTKSYNGDLISFSKNIDKLTLGDEICINMDTKQCFNFIKYDGDNIVMLAEYNLNVGKNAKGKETFMQDKDVLGYVNVDGEEYKKRFGEPPEDLYNLEYGVVPFSNDPYWDGPLGYSCVYSHSCVPKSKYGNSYGKPNYPIVYDNTYKTKPDFNFKGYYTEGYSIAYYVEEYKNILENMGVKVQEARLLTFEEAMSDAGCYKDKIGKYEDYICPKESFITNTSFWLGSAYDSVKVWGILNRYDGNGISIDFYDGEVGDEDPCEEPWECKPFLSFGVRPVIVISKNDIN